MLVLRITAFGLVRAASHPAWCGTPLFALFADTHLPALLHALATAAPGHDTWIPDLEMAPMGPDVGVVQVRGRVDVCLRKCDQASGEVALAIVPAASQLRAPVFPRMVLPRKVSLGSAVAAIKAEAAAAPLSPAGSIVSVTSVSDCGMVSDRDEDWEFDEDDEDDDAAVLRTAPIPAANSRGVAATLPTIDAIGCAFVVPSRKASTTMPTPLPIRLPAVTLRKHNPAPAARAPVISTNPVLSRPYPAAVRHWPEPARRPAAPSPSEKELEEVIAMLGAASLARTVSVV